MIANPDTIIQLTTTLKEERAKAEAQLLVTPAGQSYFANILSA